MWANRCAMMFAREAAGGRTATMKQLVVWAKRGWHDAAV